MTDLTAAERQRLGRAERVNFDTLCRAVEDIITERTGGVPIIPTESRCPCGQGYRGHCGTPVQVVKSSEQEVQR